MRQGDVAGGRPVRRRPATRRSVLLGMLGAGALGMGCSSRETAPPQAKAIPPASLEFHYHWAQGSPGEQGWTDIVNRFQATHPGVTVQLVRHGGFEKVLAAASAGTPPALIDMSPTQYAALAPRGLLAPLDPYLRRGDGVKSGDLIPALQEQARLPGGISALPSEAGVSLVFYNLDLIEEAGLPAPTRAWRWQQEFLEIARRASRDGPPESARFGVEHVYNGWWGGQWFAPLWAFGGDLLTRDLKGCALTGAEAVAGLQYVADLTHRWRVTATAPARQTAPAGRPFFETGRLALHPAGHFYYAQIKARSPFRWGVLPMPQGPAGSKGAVNGWWTGIGKATTTHDQAWTFISFYLQPQHYADFLKYVSWMPPIRAVERPPLVEDALHWEALTGAAQTARGLPMLPQFDDVLKAMNDVLQPLFTEGSGTPQAAAQQACRQAGPLLA